ncbi:MAG TPA: DinB family protein [Nocardioides sp.]|nr:DinB family protein [Nocardioides sp.]
MSEPTERRTLPIAAGEVDSLLAFLDWHRDTLRRKTEGLTQAQQATRLEPSTLTLGGLLKHMALVEDNWFSVVLLGNEDAEPWRGVDWDADPDWEFRTAADDSPEELRRLLDEAIAASDVNMRQVLDSDGLDALSVRESRRQEGRFSLRWILLHMIEEYARHNGHADLIRESIDGSTGE